MKIVAKAISWLAAAVFLAGCGPSLAISGTYFPAWIVCMLAGLVGALICRGGLLMLGLDRHIAPAGLAYPCLMLSLTLLTWLIFYSR